MSPSVEDGGFVAFYRRYTRTWVHALATAALTAFGVLATLHRGFVVLAVASYVVPPLVCYFVLPAVSGGRRLPATGEPPDENVAPDAGAASDATAPPPWTAVDAPTDATLFDAAVADGSAYAVGAGGVVLADDGDDWTVTLPDGPGAAGNTLRGVDATADGEAVWVAGDGGALGRIDGETGRHVDHSAPRGRTDTWTDVAVGGPSGDELVLLGNGSGELFRGRYRDGGLAWDVPTKPGSGSSLSGVALADGVVGYCCDTNDAVFETTDAGETTRRVGVDGVEGTPTDVATAGRGDCLASSDAGICYRYGDGDWTPVRLGEAGVAAVALRGGRALACGDGVVYERASPDGDWDRHLTSVAGRLRGIALGPDRAVAVGDDGRVVAPE